MKNIYFCMVLSLIFVTSVAFGALADPTRPVQYSGSMNSSGRQLLELSAILISKHRKVAVINGKPLQVGDMLDDAKITAIEANKVQFKTSEGDFSVVLHQPLDKQAADTKTKMSEK